MTGPRMTTVPPGMTAASTPSPSAIEPEDLRVRVAPAEEAVEQQVGGDPAEGDPVAAVAEGEIAVRELAHRADVRQAVTGLTEGAAPAPVDVAAEGGEEPGEAVLEPGGLPGQEPV